MVYVVNRKGKPLMPTKRHGHVRKLMKAGLAIPICNNPFTIKLKYDTPDIVQNMYLGIDPGRENIGIGVSDENGKCVFLSELKTSNKSIKVQMDKRRAYRQARRKNRRLRKQRKAVRDCTDFKTGNDDTLRHSKKCKSRGYSYPKMKDGSITCKIIKGKEAKFANRKRCEGWLTPSGRQLMQMHFSTVKSVMKFLPISHITLERNTFDFQKLEDADIKAWEYSKGVLYGYKSYKDYIYEQQGGKCLLCRMRGIGHYHHIKNRKEGGSDSVRNIAGLCGECHGLVHTDDGYRDELTEIKEGMYKKYMVSLLNTIMPKLVEEFTEFCSKNGISFSLTNGWKTAEYRKKHDIPKRHSTDGYVISLLHSERNEPSSPEIPSNIPVYVQQRFKKKSAANIFKIGGREYYAVDDDGKQALVAKNRHKAFNQKGDSLEEYMDGYAGSHTPEECIKHLKSLSVKPAKRVYFSHRDGKWSSIHAGDVVLYEKHNKIKGNTKRKVFVATGIDIADGRVYFGTKGRNLKFCRTLSSSCIPYTDKTALI